MNRKESEISKCSNEKENYILSSNLVKENKKNILKSSLDINKKIISSFPKIINNDKKNIFILESCKLPNYVNVTILEEYVKKDLDGNKEYLDDLNITYKISDPKKAEWMLNKSINGGILVGNGNTNVDIIVDNLIGIDVSVLTLNNNLTNEKSIMQNFSGSSNLDSLFTENKGEEVVKIFCDKLQEKYAKNKEINNIYYMIFICKDKNVYITCLKLNVNNILHMKCNGFTKSCKNISIDNFIDPKIGNVKLYKSKKRLELRLCKNIINHECSTKIF